MAEKPDNEHAHSDIADNTETGGDEHEQEMRKKLPPEIATLGKRLTFARKKRDMTQTQLADAVGVTQSAISRYETDQDLPAGNVLLKILEVLEIRWKWLETGEDPMHQKPLSEEAREIAERVMAADPARRAELLDVVRRLTQKKE